MSPLQFFRVSIVILALHGLGCSRTDVHVAPLAPPPAEPIDLESAPPPRPQGAAARLVEIDQLLARPLTGSPDEANQRLMLRAERESLIASGQVPGARIAQRAQSFTSTANQSSQHSVTRRSGNGDVENYGTNSSGHAQVIVAPNSQEKDLPFLEQMTPTERAHYYRDQAIRNRGYSVDVYHHHDHDVPSH